MPIENPFPDEYLFGISTYSQWYAGIGNYFMAGINPQDLSSRERKRIVFQSARYSWVEVYLYDTGPDQEIRNY